jgi:hypothetical protein
LFARRSRSVLATALSLAVLLSLLISCHAEAAERLAVMTFSGPRGPAISNDVSAALRSRFRLVPPRRVRATARRHGVQLNTDRGRVRIARALDLTAIVYGMVRRTRKERTLQVWIVSGYTGAVVRSGMMELSRPRLGPSGIKVLARRITETAKTIIKTQPAPKAPAPKPAPPQRKRPSSTDRRDPPTESQRPAPARRPRREGAADEDLGFEVVNPANGGSRASAPRSGEAAPAASGQNEVADGSSRQPRDDRHTTSRQASSADGQPGGNRPPVLKVSVGSMIYTRSIIFYAAMDPIDPPNFSTGPIPAPLVDIESYPLATLSRAFWTNFGLHGRFSLVPVLETEMAGLNQSMTTTVYDLDLDLRYRWSIFDTHRSPVVLFGGGMSRSLLSIEWPPGVPPLPETTYTAVTILAGGAWPVFARGAFSLVPRVTATYQYYLSAGDMERTDSAGYGAGTIHGVTGELGLDARYGGFFVRLWGSGRFIFLTFDNRCYTAGLGCKVAGGAYDITVGGGASAGYIFD